MDVFPAIRILHLFVRIIAVVLQSLGLLALLARLPDSSDYRLVIQDGG